uniref:Uncharacterized protein n=1 Tax=Pseudo-nitzschia australis TaxID=44445 RepID=A0A7S4AKQ5_9STRA|mmetsp:Transcript_14955/g.32020  ORF Transcript_14955/g.32020 Transcript_14955/m.32020 type:complete len:742 (-) Transcript_14955:243-2468(-)
MSAIDYGKGTGTRTGLGTNGGGYINVEKRLEELEMRRKMLMSAMSKVEDTETSELFQVLQNNCEEKDSYSPSYRYDTNTSSDDANANENATKVTDHYRLCEPVCQEAIDDTVSSSYENFVPIISHDACSANSPSYASYAPPSTTHCIESSEDAATYITRKPQLLSSLYQRQPISDRCHAVAEEETACLSSVVEGNDELPLQRNPTFSARPLLAALAALSTAQQDNQSSTGSSIAKNDEYHEAETRAIDDLSIDKIKENGEELLQFSVFQDENEAPSNDIPSCDGIDHHGHEFPNRRRKPVEQNQKQPKTIKYTINSEYTNLIRDQNGGDALAEIRNIKRPFNISNTPERHQTLSRQKEGTETPIPHMPVDEDFDTPEKYQDGVDCNELMNHKSLDLRASVEDIVTHTTADKTVIEGSKPNNPDATEVCESTVVNNDNDPNLALEKNLDMMILRNPLWQKALQDTYEPSLGTTIESKKTVFAEQPVSSADSPEIVDHTGLVCNNQNNETKEGFKKTIYLQSNEWSSIRPDADLDTPLASNVKNNNPFDFGVASDISDNSSDLQSTSSSSVCFKDNRDVNDHGGDGDGVDSDGDGNNCDDEHSPNSPAKPPVPLEVLTITTDFTIQSIGFTLSTQTNVESLGDESLIRTKTKYSGNDRRRRIAEDNWNGKKSINEKSTIISKKIQGLYSKGLKNLFMNPSILCQCTGPIAHNNVSSPSNAVFGDATRTGLESKIDESAQSCFN